MINMEHLNEKERKNFLNLLSLIIASDYDIAEAERRQFLMFARSFGINEGDCHEILNEKLIADDMKKLDSLKLSLTFFNENSSQDVISFVFYALVEMCYADGKLSAEEEDLILKIKEGFNVSDSVFNRIINDVVSDINLDSEYLEHTQNFSEHLMKIIKMIQQIHPVEDSSLENMLSTTSFFFKHRDDRDIDMFFDYFFSLVEDIGYRSHAGDCKRKYQKFNPFRKRVMLEKVLEMIIEQSKIALNLQADKKATKKFMIDKFIDNPPSNKMANTIITNSVMEIVKQKILTKLILM